MNASARTLLLPLLLLLWAPPAHRLAAQQVADLEPAPARDQGFDLTIRNIMRGHELVGKDPQRVRWTDDSEWIYFYWLPGGRDWHADRELYRVPAGGGEPEQLSDAEADSLAPLLSGGDLSDDRRWRVASSDGDLYLIDRRSLEVSRLTETSAYEGAPMFSADEGSVYYSQDQNLFALDIDDGGIRQLTDIRQGPEPPEEPEAEGRDAFLEEQQAELFEHIRLEKEQREEREARQEAREEGEPETVWLGERERVRGLDVNPAGTHVV